MNEDVIGCLGSVSRESKLHRHARIQRSGHHHSAAADGYQPAGSVAHGSGAGAEEQRLQAAAGRHGEPRRQRERREDSLQHESQAAGRCGLSGLPAEILAAQR